jgi:hypothetical protein
MSTLAHLVYFVRFAEPLKVRRLQSGVVARQPEASGNDCASPEGSLSRDRWEMNIRVFAAQPKPWSEHQIKRQKQRRHNYRQRI